MTRDNIAGFMLGISVGFGVGYLLRLDRRNLIPELNGKLKHRAEEPRTDRLNQHTGA